MSSLISLLVALTFTQAPIDFADYLYQTGDWSRAALEYERIGVLELTDSAWASYALLRAGEALLKADDPARASRIYSFGIRNLRYDRARFTYGLLRAEFAQGYFDVVDSLVPLLQGTESEEQSRTYNAFGLALSGDIQEAQVGFLELEPTFYRDSALAVITRPLRQRSPWLSAGFSTVLPGAGQAYCGRWGDAWQSFSVTALFAGAAVYYFFFSADTSTGNTVKGSVTASLGGLFWLANIYGAANAALDYNEYQERKRSEQLKNLIKRFDLEPEIKRP